MQVNMKRILYILLLLPLFVRAQDEKPPAGLINVFNTFYVTADGQLWIYKGPAKGWNRMARYGDLLVAGTGSANVRTNAQQDSETAANYFNKTQTTTLLNTKTDTTGQTLGAKRNFGAKGNAVISTDITMNGNQWSSPSWVLTAADIGKTIAAPYTGTDTTIDYTSSGGGIYSPHVYKTMRGTITAIINSNTAKVSFTPVHSPQGPTTLTGVSISAGAYTVTITGGTVTNADMGKQIRIAGAGKIKPDSALVCYITKINSSTSFNVNNYSDRTISSGTIALPGAWVAYGSDDTQPLRNLFSAGAAQGKPVRIEAGKYLTTDSLTIPQGLSDVGGDGMFTSILYPVGNNYSAIQRNQGTSNNVLRNTIIHDFGIDAMGVTNNFYLSNTKGVFLRPATNLKVLRLYVANTSATGIGNDFLRRSEIASCVIEHAGRQTMEFGLTAPAYFGGNGIGIGTGAETLEEVIVHGNYISNVGNYGILAEGQNSLRKSTGSKFYHNTITASFTGNMGDFGTDGAEFNNNYSYHSNYDLVIGTTVFVNNLYARNGIYKNNLFTGINGVLLQSQDMGQHFEGNIYKPDSTLTNPNGFVSQLIAGGIQQKPLVLINEDLAYYTSKGVSVEQGTGVKYSGVIAKGLRFYNIGISSSQKAAFRTFTPISNLLFTDATAIDNRTAKGTSYGFQITGMTVDNMELGNNNYKGMGLGSENIAGTVTNLTHRVETAYANNFTATQTFGTTNTSTGNIIGTTNYLTGSNARYYNTSTLTSEYANIGWNTNQFKISTSLGTTGAARGLYFESVLNQVYNNINSNSFSWQFAGVNAMTLTTNGLNILTGYNLNIANATANTLTKFDASKNVVSAVAGVDYAGVRGHVVMSVSVTGILNYDYLNTTTSTYTITVPTTTGFAADGSSIITALQTGTGTIRIACPSGYTLTTPSGQVTPSTGYASIAQNQKVQLIPIGANAWYIQPLNGSITVN